MIRLAQSASLLAGFFLLTSVATVYAECAWVLWLKTDYDAALEGEWTVIHALATRQTCIASLEEPFKETGKATGNEAIARRAEAMERAAASGSLLVVARGRSELSKCLPDTFDPRGPKG